MGDARGFRLSLVAGVDSSTQSCKIVVCDAATGQIVRESRAAHPDGTSVDPERWWEALVTATSDGLLEDVEAIAIGGQQHGMVALDEHDEVVRDALLWNDTRSADAAGDLVRELGGAQTWAEQVGSVPVAAFTVSKVRWLAEHEPESAERTQTVVLPHDWITGRLLRERGGFDGWSTDRGDASGTGYWSAREGRYRDDLMELALGRVFEVPRVLEPAETAGTVANGMIVAAGTGDNMGAGLGLGLQPGDVVVSLGTSGTVFTVSQTCPTDPTGAVAGFADATGQFLPLMCTLNAARVLTAAVSMLGVDLSELDRLALAAEPGAGGLSLLPYLDGERTPDLPHATGTLSGLTRSNATPENIARAAVEGMLLNLRDGVEALRGQGAEVDRVLLIGGASASTAVQQVAGSLFGVPVSVPAPAEYVGIGAARQAAWALSGEPEPPEWSPALTAQTGADGIPDPSGPQNEEMVQRYAELRQTVHRTG